MSKESKYIQPGAHLYAAIMRYSMERAPRTAVVDAFFRHMRYYGHWSKDKVPEQDGPAPIEYQRTVQGRHTGIKYYVASGYALKRLDPALFYVGRIGHDPLSPGLDSPDQAEAYIDMLDEDIAEETLLEEL